MKIIRYVVLLFYMTLGSVAHAQTAAHSPTGKLSGDVADVATKTPVAKAFVLVHQPEGKKDFIVKVSNGKFELALAPGRYDVFVSAAGFAPDCKSIKIAASETVTYAPRLAHAVD